MFWRVLKTISSKLTIAIPVSLLGGFIYGLFFDPIGLKSLIVPFTFLMVYPMMINLDWSKLLSLKDSRLIAVAQLVNFVLLPLAAFGLGMLFFSDRPYMALGILLASLFPTSGMTITWTGFSKGNVEGAVKLTLLGLTLGSIFSPFYVKFLMGKAIPVNIFEVFRQIFIIVIVPLIAGALTRVLFVRTTGQEKFKKVWAQRFPSVSSLGVLGIVFIAIALKSKSIAANPLLLIYAVVPLIVLYILNVVIATWVGKKYFRREDGIALVFGTVARNLSIALAVAINAFGEGGSEAALVLSAAFIIQSQAMAWYAKLSGKIFGELQAEHSSDKEAQGKVELVDAKA